jgi:type IV pilus assembly protein PilV
MEMSKLQNRKAKGNDGFALIEVMIAIVILAVGLLGLAALMAQLTGTTGQSRYMGTMVVLASEKLEDLNRIPVTVPADPAIFAADGGTAGSITADTGPLGGVVYFDQVQLSSENGTFVAPSAANGKAAGASSDMLIFKRRWVIEKDPAGLPAGVRRITVRVTLLDGTQEARATTFQTSMVRP